LPGMSASHGMGSSAWRMIEPHKCGALQINRTSLV
jgi:hypothetical protein